MYVGILRICILDAVLLKLFCNSKVEPFIPIMMPSISLSMSYLKYRCDITHWDYPYLPTKGSSVGRTRLDLARLQGVARITHPREICKNIYLHHRLVFSIQATAFDSMAAENRLLQESPSGRIFRFAVGQSGPTPNPSTLEGSFLQSTRTPFGRLSQYAEEPLRNRCALSLEANFEGSDSARLRWICEDRREPSRTIGKASIGSLPSLSRASPRASFRDPRPA